MKIILIILGLHILTWLISSYFTIKFAKHPIYGDKKLSIQFCLRFLYTPFGLPLLFVISIIWEVLSWISNKIMSLLFQVTRKYI